MSPNDAMRKMRLEHQERTEAMAPADAADEETWRVQENGFHNKVFLVCERTELSVVSLDVRSHQERLMLAQSIADKLNAHNTANQAPADGETWLSVERWPLGDTEERNPMYCLYLKGPKVNAGLGWMRIGDVWDQEGAEYLEALQFAHNTANQTTVARAEDRWHKEFTASATRGYWNVVDEDSSIVAECWRESDADRVIAGHEAEAALGAATTRLAEAKKLLAEALNRTSFRPEPEYGLWVDAVVEFNKQ